MLGRVQLTTTSSVDGWVIEDYCGLVTASLVAGTGLFSDFAAGLSDLFGGRSGSYRKQLVALQSEVLDELKQQALGLGANWILGVRLDFDEISGKGMQMFMVSAQGTAVVARGTSSTASSAPVGRVVRAAELASGLLRSELVNKVNAGQIDLTSPASWEAISENGVDEAVPLALRHVHFHQDRGYAAEVENAQRRALDFFRALPVLKLQQRLHDSLADAELEEVASHFIVDLNVVDLGWVLRHLEADEFRLKRAALQLLSGTAISYGLADLELMDGIVARLATTFPERVGHTEKKGVFSRSTEQRWVCGCGTDNSLSNDNCSKCDCDKRGLRQSDLTPEAAADRISSQLGFLRRTLMSVT